MSIVKGFKNLPKYMQIILLLIPFVNWVTEMAVRISAFINNKSNESLLGLVLAIIPVTGIILGWVDLAWCLLYGKLIFID